MHDNLGTRMKSYEDNSRFLPLAPIVARIDGKCFSSFTKGLARPYDNRLSNLMIATTKYLVHETCACIGYTQSDEITLIFYSDQARVFMDGKQKKIISILASMTTGFFNFHMPLYLPEKTHTFAMFDARADLYPSQSEAVNNLVWRELDAIRNSVSAAARTVASHKSLHRKNVMEMLEILKEKGIDWNEYPTYFKRGIYVQRKTTTRKFTSLEIESLPPKHQARLNPDLEVVRHDVQEIKAPPILQIANKIEFVFDGAEPIIKNH